MVCLLSKARTALVGASFAMRSPLAARLAALIYLMIKILYLCTYLHSLVYRCENKTTETRGGPYTLNLLQHLMKRLGPIQHCEAEITININYLEPTVHQSQLCNLTQPSL